MTPKRTPSRSAPPSSTSWRTWVAAWTRSGLSARAFAAQHDLNPATLYGWRRRLRAETAPAVVPAPRIVPITLEAPAVCELQLRDGRILRVPVTIAPDVLRRLLAALEAP